MTDAELQQIRTQLALSGRHWISTNADCVAFSDFALLEMDGEFRNLYCNRKDIDELVQLAKSCEEYAIFENNIQETERTQVFDEIKIEIHRLHQQGATKVKSDVASSAALYSISITQKNDSISLNTMAHSHYIWTDARNMLNFLRGVEHSPYTNITVFVKNDVIGLLDFAKNIGCLSDCEISRFT